MLMTTLFDQLDRRGKHPNSREAYRDEKPRLNKRAAAILADVRRHGRATDRQIRDRMGYSDMNQVRPRITELVDAGLLRECDKVRDPQTGKRVRVVEVTT